MFILYVVSKQLLLRPWRAHYRSERQMHGFRFVSLPPANKEWCDVEGRWVLLREMKSVRYAYPVDFREVSRSSNMLMRPFTRETTFIRLWHS
jgi:hypothetical protein